MNEENMSELYSDGITELKKMNEGNSANAPEKKFRAGQVVATVWKQPRKEDQQYDKFLITVEKNYKDREGNWKTTSSFNLNELPKVEFVSHQAYGYILTRSEGQ